MVEWTYTPSTQCNGQTQNDYHEFELNLCNNLTLSQSKTKQKPKDLKYITGGGKVYITAENISFCSHYGNEGFLKTHTQKQNYSDVKKNELWHL